MSVMIRSDQVFFDGMLQQAALEIEGGSISNVIFGDIPTENEAINLTGYRVIPGLIDTHMHGGNGFDTMDCKEESVQGMSDYLAEVGVTTFYPTTVTSSRERTASAVRVVADCIDKGVSGAKIGGIYLEGPYITAKMKGAHPEEFIRKIDMDELQYWIDESRGNVRTVALSPENLNVCETIRKLGEQGITVTLGHSDATYEQTRAAIAAGARAGIHIYNAMRPLHHREPGILGATLTTDGFAAELICDGIHVHPCSAQVVTRCKKPDDVLLITDCICAGGMPDGRYHLGEMVVLVESGVARTESGALAGSTLRLLDAVKNMVQMVGTPFETALRFATENPARQLGIFEQTGSLKKGKAADVVAIDADYNVVFTMIDGRIVVDNRHATRG